MYLFLAMILIMAGICLFVSANWLTKNGAAVISMKIVGIVLVTAGLSMSYLLFSGKVVLPLSRR